MQGDGSGMIGNDSSNNGSDDHRSDIIANMLRFAVLNKCIDAIDKMLNDKAVVDSISIAQITLDDIYTRFSYEENVFAVYIKGIGDIKLTLLLIIKGDNMKRLTEVFIGNTLGYEASDELMISAVAEFGNILLAGAFTNALTNLAGFRIDCTAPGYANDTLASIMEYIIADSEAVQFVYAESRVAFKVNKDITLTISLLIPAEDVKKIVELAFK